MNNYSQARTFNRELYNESDEKAKQLFKAHLESKGHIIIKDIEDYEHDLVSSKNGKIFYFELELKLAYQFKDEASFKFDTVSFLGRKERLHKIQPFHYIIICPDTKMAITAYSDDIYNEQYKVERYANQAYKQGLDCFYRTPKDKTRFFKLEN